MGVLLLLLLAGGGLALLWRAADLLVDGASRTAARLSVPPLVVGAVVVGFGTSTPETLVSTLAAVEGSMDLAVGNVVGSNTANLSLVLGSAALLGPVAVGRTALRRDLPLAALATLLLAVLVQGGLRRADGVFLLLGLVVALAVLLRPRRGGALEDGPVPAAARPGTSLRRDVALLLVGLLGVLLGAQLLVTGARGLAEQVGLSEGFVGLTLVAVGTSAPELATALAAARRSQSELVVGNVLGSNMFNATFVAGLAGVVAPGPVTDPGLTVVAVGAMLATTALAAVAMTTRGVVGRGEAVGLLVVWLGLLPFSL